MKKKLSDLLVSVVMPVHNGDKFLRAAIESVLIQTHEYFELVIVENCSNDSSIDIINSFNDPRIRLVKESNCGIVNAYNRGFKEASGEYIFIHDQDDISHPSRIELQLKFLIENNLKICSTNFSMKFAFDQANERLIKGANLVDFPEIIFLDHYYLHHPTLLICKCVFKEIGYYNESFYPLFDYEFILRSLYHVKSGRLKESLYYWRRHNLAYGIQNSKEYFLRNELSLFYLEKNKEILFQKKEFYIIKGMIHYYSNYFCKAIFFLLKDIYSRKTKKFLVIKYIIYSAILWPIIIILRKIGFFK